MLSPSSSAVSLDTDYFVSYWTFHYQGYFYAGELVSRFTGEGQSMKLRKAISFAIAAICGGLATGPTAAQSAAVPPPPLQYTADCSRPIYAIDHLTCSDSSLRALDAKLRYLIETRGNHPSPAYIEPDADWFRRRGLCAFQVDQKRCASSAYAERIAVLEAIAKPPPADLIPLTCDRADARQFVIANDTLLLYDKARQLLAVAFRPGFQRPWQDFVTFSRKGRHISLIALDKRGIQCRTLPVRP